MKIRLSYTVDIDPELWERAYGVGKDEIREDVRSYMRNLIQQCAAAEETDLTIVD
jgi:hypothetical protein